MDPKAFSQHSQLISQPLEQQLKVLLARISQPVELTCLVDDGAKSAEMGAFLNHLVSLSENLKCRFLLPGEDARSEQALDGSMLPATGVAPVGELPRMVFHGIPGGKEINSFASALLNAGAAAKPLDKATLKDIGKIRREMHLQVCVSLGCQHCAQLVSHAQRVAWENPLVTAHMVDANLYPQMVSRWNIERVPLTVVNEENQFPGGKTMAELTTLLLKM